MCTPPARLHSEQTCPCCSFGRVRMVTGGFREDGEHSDCGEAKKGKLVWGHMPFARVAVSVNHNANLAEATLLAWD